MKRVVVAIAFGVSAACWGLSAGNLRAEPLGVDAAATATSAGEKIKEVDEAVELFKRQDFVGAMKLLETAAKSHPDMAPAPLLMAELFSRANLPGGVRNMLERAVLDNPADPEAYIILGDVAANDGRVTEADLLYAKGSTVLAAFKGSGKRKDEMQKRVLNGMAMVAEARRDWPAAQKQLEALLKLDAKDPRAMVRLAQAMFLQPKDPKGAANAYDVLKKAKQADPSVLQPEAQLALLYEQYPSADDKEREANHANAKKWIANALKQAPKDPQVWLTAARWALETGDISAAKTYASEANKLDDKSLEAKILRGIVALFQHEYKEAQLYFEHAHNQSPSNFAASNNLALALVEQDDESRKRQALEYAENNARQFPKVAEAASTYGWVLFKNGRRDEAEKALNVAASSGNVSPDTAFYLASVIAGANRPDDAKKLLQAALDTKRPFAKKDEAKALLDKLEKSNPGPAKEPAKPAAK